MLALLDWPSIKQYISESIAHAKIPPSGMAEPSRQNINLIHKGASFEHFTGSSLKKMAGRPLYAVTENPVAG